MAYWVGEVAGGILDGLIWLEDHMPGFRPLMLWFDRLGRRVLPPPELPKIQ